MARPTSAVLFLININLFYYFLSDVVCERVNNNNTIAPKIAIPKCCAENQAVFISPIDGYTMNCTDYGAQVSLFANITVYDKNIHDKVAQKEFNDTFRVVTDMLPTENDLATMYILAEFLYTPYLNEEGVLYLEYPNAYERWSNVNRSNYCIDYELEYIIENNTTALSSKFKFWVVPPGSSPQQTNPFFTAALVISSFFLFLVLLVYMLLPGLRNLCGMVLMAYVFSLQFAFLFLFIIQIDQYQADTCIALTTITYFFFLASFCWMNVMSYDIWWTFRGYAKARPIHRRGENFKFLMYSIYGFGLPLAMSIAFVNINNADLRHFPWLVKPLVPQMGCFIENGQKLVYLYAPMLILIICNWIFFLMTAFNIWRINRDTAVLDSPAAGNPQLHRKQRERLFIYLKLFIIMGVNWLLEVLSSLTPNLKFWIISDIYNLLIGLFIAIIFIGKRKILEQLKKAVTERLCCRQDQKWQRPMARSHTSTTTLSNTSQAVPLQVYRHPNGHINKNDLLYSH